MLERYLFIVSRPSPTQLSSSVLIIVVSSFRVTSVVPNSQYTITTLTTTVGLARQELIESIAAVDAGREQYIEPKGACVLNSVS